MGQLCVNLELDWLYLIAKDKSCDFEGNGVEKQTSWPDSCSVWGAAGVHADCVDTGVHCGRPGEKGGFELCKLYRSHFFPSIKKVGNQASNQVIKESGETLFWFTFGTSLTTSTIGLTNTLLHGPCRILTSPLGLRGAIQYVLIFMSCALMIITKVVCYDGFQNMKLYDFPKDGTVLPDLDFPKDKVLATVFIYSVKAVPILVYTLWCVCHKRILTTFLEHPSVLLLPMFTPFTLISSSKCCFCCRDEKTSSTQEHIRFSWKYSFICVAVHYISCPTTILKIYASLKYGPYSSPTDLIRILTIASAIPMVVLYFFSSKGTRYFIVTFSYPSHLLATGF